MQRIRMHEQNIKIMKSEANRVNHEICNAFFATYFFAEATNARVKENADKIKLNKQLPHLVSNVVEVLPAFFTRA